MSPKFKVEKGEESFNSLTPSGAIYQPTKVHMPVTRFYKPEEFDMLKDEAQTPGFKHVESGPLVRSSYHTEQQTVPASV